MNALPWCAAALILAMGDVARAQTAGTGAPGLSPSRFLVHAPDVAKIQDNWSGGFEVAQWWVKKFAQDRMRSRLQKMTADAVAAATSTVQWTDQGVLFEIRVARSTGEELTGWYAAQIIGDAPIQSGVGATPEQALFSYYSTPWIKLPVPNGYVLDDVLSGYFWVAKTSSGTIGARVVDRGTVRELQQRMQSAYGDLEMKYQLERMNAKETWQAIAAEARRRMAARDSQRAVDAALKTVLDSQARVTDTNRRLQVAIEKEQQAANTLQMLQVLKFAVDATSLAQTAMQDLSESSARFNGANTPEAIIKRVEEIRTAAGTNRAELEIQVKLGSSNLQQALDGLWQRIQPANPPPGVQTSLRLTRP